ncbi:MAG: metallophosphoesterase family protein [Silicimonas sp.]|nr:metallophosphoesterase family protein [Silicimonas sp.]
MTLAVISDIHGNISALDAVLDDIARRDISRIVNLGDSLSGPFDAPATADRLIALDLPTVRGNHDRQLYDRRPDQMGLWESWAIDDLSQAHLAWLKDAPLNLVLDDAFLCHGTPGKDDENWLDKRGPMDRLVPRDLAEILPNAQGIAQDLILCGHTHTPRIVRLPGGKTIVNPGSVGCPAYLDTRMKPEFVHQTGAPDARYAIVERRGGQWAADLIAAPYDPEPMAKLARQKNADSWAQAITTGWFA